MPTQTVHSATGKPTITAIGIFPFKTYGSLIKRELKWFEDQASKRINAVLPLYKLAKKISEDEAISENDALAIVNDLGNPENSRYSFKYVEFLGEIQKQNYSESDFKADIVTMFIQSRIASSQLFSIYQDLFDYYGIEFDSEVGWVEFYTECLPETVIDEINDFVLAEKSRLSPSTKSDTEVTLGK